jgi:hypothetical protein
MERDDDVFLKHFNNTKRKLWNHLIDF